MTPLQAFQHALAHNIARRTGGKLAKRAPAIYGGQNAAKMSHSQIMALPAIYVEPIRDMDPDSPTFGQIKFMAGIDGLGSVPLA